MTNHEKYRMLIQTLKDLKNVVVAFSGGVDSTFLLHAAKEALGENVTAVTIVSPYIPKWEVEEARTWTERMGISHVFLETGIIDEIRHNPKDRCYLCKRAVFGKIKDYAEKMGVHAVLDGTNVDDLSDYRPGLKALSELQVISPLKECGLGKEEIRQLSHMLGLETWNKPAYACLLTRIPYDTELKEEDFRKIEEAEVFLIKMGFPAVRVRAHGDVARIEVPKDQRQRFFDDAVMDAVVRGVKEAGFAYVALDLEGYRMGSFLADVQERNEEFHE